MDTKKLLMFMVAAKEKGYSDEDIQKFVFTQSLASKLQGNQDIGGIDASSATLNYPEGDIPITQGFGQKSKYDVFSGGINYGVDFGVGENTAITAPEGIWDVIETRGGAKGKGYIGNKTNSGYGNTTVLRNKQTGESVRLSHLARLIAQTGQTVQGGSMIGLSGQTGNVTGPHLDVEYRNKQGKLDDILKTTYAKQLFAQKQ